MWKSISKLGSILESQDGRGLLRLFFCILVMTALEIAGIFSIFPFMQLVANPEIIETNPYLAWAYDTIGFSSHRNMLISAACVVLTIYLTTSVFSVFTSWLIQKTIWATSHRLSMRLLNLYARFPYQYFVNNNSVELVKRLVSDIRNLTSGVLLSGVQFFASAFKSVVILLLLFSVNAKLALIAFFASAGVYTLVHAIRHSYLEKLGRLRLTTLSARFKAFTETLTGMKSLRVSGSTDWFLRRYERASEVFCEIQPKFQLYNQIPRYLTEFVTFGGIIGVILYLLIAKVDMASAIPTLSIFALATYKLLPALNKAFAALATLSHNLPIIDDVYNDLESDCELIQPAHDFRDATPLPFETELRLDGVSFQYDASGLPVLQDINVRIPKASVSAIVGPTGCGKSTLIDIMVGLLVPSQGQFLVDGTAVTRENIFGWRKNMAYVPQDVFLFDDTVRANIAIGIAPEQIDEERLVRAARLAQVDKFVREELANGYDTIVGERGLRLSGGQKQRIGLARAFYQEPKVLFLDEATSALDSVTEEAVISSIETELPDVTVIMIAHRLSTIKYCDQIFLIDSGRVIESGTYDELLQGNSRFRYMVEAAE